MRWAGIGVLMVLCGLASCHDPEGTPPGTTTHPPATEPPTPLRVSSTSPADGEPGIPQDGVVRVTFTKDVNVATVNVTSFTLSSTAGPVAADVSYDAATKTATLTPLARLASQTVYTATIKPDIQDAEGRPLEMEYSWKFGSRPGWRHTHCGAAKITHVFFVDPLRGWAMTPGSIFKTIDGGKSWHAYHIWPPGEYAVSLTDIHFVDAEYGWCVGTGFTLGERIIARTANGGLSWELVPMGETPGTGGIFFANRNTGWMAEGQGRIFRSDDGGAT